jgi:hypothetical protein
MIVTTITAKSLCVGEAAPGPISDEKEQATARTDAEILPLRFRGNGRPRMKKEDGSL